jgi:glycosyltransferase involved in cell wall biosynthesis
MREETTIISDLRGRTIAGLFLQSLRYAISPRPKTRVARNAPTADPLISVIIPTYNWSRVLKLAMRSVLWQTEQDFEVLVIGDGCTDDSESVVQSVGDARIRWHNLEKNSGHQATPNNAGASLARGKYIAILGHDDIWHPRHLESLLRTITSESADIASAFTEMIGPFGSNFRVINGIYPPEGFTAAEALVPSGLMLRRGIPEQIGGWRDYRTIHRNPDLDFVSRAWKVGCRFASTEELTVFKFNSAFRRNSYVEKPCHEQAAYVARIESDRWFLFREAFAMGKARLFREPMQAPKFSPPPDAEALGWEVSQYRKFRGLE